MRKRLVVVASVAVWAAGVGSGWLLLPPQPLVEWSLPDDCQVVALLPGTHTLVTAYKSGGYNLGPFDLWDLDTGTKTGSHPGPAERFSVSHLGTYGVGRADQLIHMFLYDGDRHVDHERLVGSSLIDVAIGREVYRSTGFDLQLVPPGRTFVVGRKAEGGDRAELFAAADGRSLGSFPGTYRGSAAGGRFMLTTRTGPDGSTLTVWESDTGQAVGAVPDLNDQWWRVQVTADGRTLVTRAGEVWDVPTGAFRYTVDAATALTPDGRGLLVGRRDGDRVRFRRHDLASGEPDPGRGFAVPYKRSRGAQPVFSVGPGDRLYVFGESADQADTAPGWWGRPKTTRILNRCQVLDLATGRRLLTADGCQLVAITDDGERLVYRYQDGDQLGPLTVWAIPPGPPVERLAALAVGWASVVGLIAWRLCRSIQSLGEPPAGPKGGQT